MIYTLSIILGIVQALTEFLPISSSAHLILFRAWLDFDFVDGLTFDVALHVGTLIAIVVYFFGDIAAIAKGFFGSLVRWNVRGDAHQRLAWFVIAACVPAALAGAFLEAAIEIYARNPVVIVVTLVLGGVLFLVVERAVSHKHDLSRLTFGGAMLIGLFQTLALIPGVSRSGITIAVGMTQKLKREEAARFSFLMSAPLLFGAGLKKALDLAGYTLQEGEVAVLVTGLVASAVVGWLVIRFLLGFLRNHGLGLFAYYRFALAAVVAVYLLSTR
jgi:undecaprenyl-diphosphatase